MEPDPFLTMNEVCARYKFRHRQHVDRLVREGRFPKPIKLGGRLARWLKSELIAWEAARIAERDAHNAA